MCSNIAILLTVVLILDISTEQFETTFKTNVYTMLWITKTALPHMKAGFTIVCTASIYAFDPEPSIFDDSLTTRATAIFVKALADNRASFTNR